MALDVFISYSTKDKVIADTVVSSLESYGIRCWYAPRDIHPAEDWGNAITNAILECRVFLLIFSGNANHSQRVLDELNFAIGREVIILPFRVENLEPQGAMGLHLSSRHWLDAYDPSWKSHLQLLNEIVAANLKTEGKKAVSPPPLKHEWLTQPPSKKKLARPLIGFGILLALIAVSWLILSRTGIFKGDSGADIKLVAVDNSAANTVEETKVAGKQEGTLNIAFSSDTLELDPQLVWENDSATLAENLFVNLTNYDPASASILPEAAESWSISPDGKFYTFTLRQDIPWVKHPLGGNTVQEENDQGEERFVTAQDFVYAVRRICSPALIDGLSFNFIPLIKGCQEVSQYPDPDNIPQDLIEAIGVKAINDHELLIELTESSAYFLTMTTMSMMSAVPYWAMDTYGEAWKNPGVIPTNGYYLIDDFQLGNSMRLIRNPLFPQDLAGSGNVDTVQIQLELAAEDAYLFWQEGLLDISEIPAEFFTEHQNLHSQELFLLNRLSIDYFDLNSLKAPFNNVHVRRAFAAALDKEKFVDITDKYRSLPMYHIGVPGIVGSLPIEETGQEFNPQMAKDELALAGYPDCVGFPALIIYTTKPYFYSASMQILNDWENALGCPSGTLTVAPTSKYSEIDWENSDIIYVGWANDFPDMHNVIGNILSCDNSMTWSEVRRECNKIDDLIVEARQEINPKRRADLYAQIESSSFNEEGVFPIIPVKMNQKPIAVHAWLKMDAFLSLQQIFYNWEVDMDKKESVNQ